MVMRRPGAAFLIAILLAATGCNGMLGIDVFSDNSADGSPEPTQPDASFEIDATTAGDAAADATSEPPGVTMTGVVPDDAAASAPGNDANDGGLDSSGGSGSCPGDYLPCEAGCASRADIHTCGSCGNDCTELPGVSGASVACNNGRCSYACAPSYADCVDSGAGCPTHVTSTSSCGGCGVACTSATPVCAEVDAGPYACSSGCSAGQTNCSGTCATLASDPSHCGACGAVCTLTNAAATCASSKCAISSCHLGYADCDHVAANGCEVNTTTGNTAHCGGCGKACNLANATAACVASACAVSACATGFADCDHMAANGCEVNTTTGDPSNCGGCGKACNLANATAACVSSACAVSTCATGFVDCDHTAMNGCEINIQTDSKNCGTCGNDCGGRACIAGSCAMPVVVAPNQSGAYALAVDANNVYWTTTTGTVNQASTAGTNLVQLSSGWMNPLVMALDSSYVYWAESTSVGSINRAPIGMTAMMAALTPATLVDPQGLAVHGGVIYFTETGANAGGHLATVDTSQNITNFLSGLTAPSSLVADDTFLYWVDVTDGQVNKLSRSLTTTTFVSLAKSQAQPWQLAVDDVNVYWTNKGDNSVNQVPINGGTVTVLATNQGAPAGIASDGGYVYWANSSAGTINRIPVSAAVGTVPQALATGEATPQSVVVTANAIYWTDSANPGGSVKTLAK